MSNRTLIVKNSHITQNTNIIGKVTSTIQNVGVPQGSVLGPLIISIYIYELAQNVTEEKVILPVDDTNVLIKTDEKRNATKKNDPAERDKD